MWGGREDPFSEMDHIFRRFTSFGPFVTLGSSSDGSTGRSYGFGTSSRGSWLPNMDLSESPTHYTLVADTPGMKKEDLEVNVTESRICVKGVRKAMELAAAGGDNSSSTPTGPLSIFGGNNKQTNSDEKPRDYYHLNERGYGPFERCMTLPQRIVESSVNASYVDGVLSVAMTKEKPTTTSGSGSSKINIR